MKIPEGDYDLEYRDIRAAWHDYLAHYNDGRGVVLLGHSQGSYLFEPVDGSTLMTSKHAIDAGRFFNLVGSLLVGRLHHQAAINLANLKALLEAHADINA